MAPSTGSVEHFLAELYGPEVLERFRLFPIEEAEELVERSRELWPPAPADDTGPSHSPPDWMGRRLDPYVDWAQANRAQIEEPMLARYEFRDQVRDLLYHFRVGRVPPASAPCQRGGSPPMDNLEWSDRAIGVFVVVAIVGHLLGWW